MPQASIGVNQATEIGRSSPTNLLKLSLNPWILRTTISVKKKKKKLTKKKNKKIEEE